MLPPDLYRGMPSSFALMYVAKPLTEASTPIPELGAVPRKAGYQLVNIICGATVSVATLMGLPIVPVNVIAPSASFPDLRPCLKSQPQL
jgi:hypothetical protein